MRICLCNTPRIMVYMAASMDHLRRVHPMQKDLGPVNHVSYTFPIGANTTTVSECVLLNVPCLSAVPPHASQKLDLYFNGLCDLTAANNHGVGCLPYIFDYTQGGWIPK